MHLPEESKNDLESLINRERLETFIRSVSSIIALFLIGCIAGLFVWLFI
jgi:hypothetical protein